MLLAVSSCLLGNNVRYDGSNQMNKFVLKTLSEYAQFVPFCPEHLALGTPRETIRIISEKEKDLELKTVFTKEDVTSKVFEASSQEIDNLKKQAICGIILKSKSPSCGLGSTKYYENGMPQGKKDGVFAAMCKEEFKYLPIEEEARLNDAWLRENFIMQIFAYSEVEELSNNITKFNELVEFHTSYKYLLHSKNEVLYRELGNIVANHEKKSLKDIMDEYKQLFKQTIATKSKISKTVNVLEHMVGFFKKDLTSKEKIELKDLIAQYKEKIIPLITVIALIKMFSVKYEKEFLLKQKFLHPYPDKLALRSDINSGK
ncbi:YbgA family protein [Malaciobacter canalis]|uniref:YbgA family protein n=1 Tax=Malaciobacter canalis TaxID=1912871 RepID=UPI00384F8470